MIMIAWHAEKIDNVLKEKQTQISGLSSEEAAKRLKKYGKNELVWKKKGSVLLRFLRQFHNILIYVLLASACITAYLGYHLDTSVILGVVVINAIFGFIQEGKAEQAMEAIRAMLAPNAIVVRDGTAQMIPANELVPGDIVQITTGNKIPADLRLIKVKNLQIEESILTGESQAVEKKMDAVLPDAPLGERFSMAYSGTWVTYGRGTGIVVGTANDTEIGRIGALLKKIKPLTTPLIQQMNRFAVFLTFAIITVTFFVSLVGIFVWQDTIERVFMASVSLAVAAIPEGLPAILTIILAIGVTRMAKRNAIIRQLPAVETMGAVTTICTDKTGTLTYNEQQVIHVMTATNHYHVQDHEHFAIFSEDVPITLKANSELEKVLTVVNLCQEPETLNANAVDRAIQYLGQKAGLDIKSLFETTPQTDHIPYESRLQKMATLHHDHSGQNFIYMKGAPERILAACKTEYIKGEIQPLNEAVWTDKIQTLAAQGYRLIAVAYRELKESKQQLLFEDTQDDFTLLALLALMDPPRIEAIQAVKECYDAGIQVKMITGDHAKTAATIANELGLSTKNGILTGQEIDDLSDEGLKQKVKAIDVYARTTPEHKLRLVNALQANHEVVAMTGDGVNDAPALRKAEIGIAMGRKGAEAAKEASAMVLADDNFATIVNAIKEGRTVYDNLKKVLLFILPTNVAEAMIIIVTILFGLVSPITPLQILWVNMTTAITLSIALGFEPAEEHIMHNPPRHPKTPLLSRFLIWRILFVATLLVACVFAVFLFEKWLGTNLQITRTAAVNMIVLSEAFYLLNCRKIYSFVNPIQSVIRRKAIWISIAAVMGLQLLFIYVPLMQHFFHTQALSLFQWFYSLIFAIIVFIFVEIEKYGMRRFRLALTKSSA